MSFDFTSLKGQLMAQGRSHTDPPAEQRGSVPTEVRNSFLNLLPKPERSRLIAACEEVHWEPGQILAEPDSLVEQIYFPLTGVAAVQLALGSGETVEVASIGNEGVIGPALMPDLELPLGRLIVQVPGAGLLLPLASLRRQAGTSRNLTSLLRRYSHLLMQYMAQDVICCRLHTVENRCARFLLMTQDRVGGPELQLTQEQLAESLTVRRASVNAAAAKLRQAGHIRYVRGVLTVLNREALQRVACECYQTRQELYRKLLG